MKKEKLTPVEFMKECQRQGGLFWAGFENGLSLDDIDEDYEDFYEQLAIIYDTYEQFQEMEKVLLDLIKDDWSPIDD